MICTTVPNFEESLVFSPPSYALMSQKHKPSLASDVVTILQKYLAKIQYFSPAKIEIKWMTVFYFVPSDIDECAEGNKCGEGSCRNTPGSFVCVCQNGSVFSYIVNTVINRYNVLYITLNLIKYDDAYVMCYVQLHSLVYRRNFINLQVFSFWSSILGNK